MKDMAQTERQIFILLLLSENKRGYTINDIHASLKKWDVIVDKKTIGRDIDSLSGICFISEEERNGKIYYTADKFRLRDITFTSPELISLSFLLELIKPYQNLTMGRTSQELIHKLLDNTTNLNREFIRHFTGLVTINTNDYITDEVKPEIEEHLQTAIRNKFKIRITYHSFGQDEDTIRIKPCLTCRSLSIPLIPAYMAVFNYICLLSIFSKKYLLTLTCSLYILIL